MSDYKQKLTEKDFQNWLKAALAISICKKGIETCVNRTVHETQADILSRILNSETCTQCSIENMIYCQTKSTCSVQKGHCAFHNTEEKQCRPCPRNICDKFKAEIARRHKHKPSWKNTRVEEWSQNAWEIAKCYMAPEGYAHVTCIADTDLNGILSVVENLQDCKTLFEKETIRKAREVSNNVRHSPNLSIHERVMQEYLEALVHFLNSSKDAECATAAKDIQKLQQDQLMISASDISNVLRDVIEENVHDMNMQQLKFLKETKDALNTVQISTTENLSQILLALKDLKETTKDVLAEIQREKDELKKIRKISSSEYEENKIKLKEDLITYNEKHHSTIALSPLSEKRDSHFLNLYVNPPITAVEQPMKDCRRSDIITPLSSLDDIFKQGIGEIYLTSKAGLGKTVFCKRVAVNWCRAHDPEFHENEVFEEADTKAMLKYDFLFIVLLRNTLPSHCDIDEMINHQVIGHLSRSTLFDDKFIQEVLTQESCLVILDGLDEWSHPTYKESCMTMNDIPHRKARKNCTILTTSRYWKFNQLTLSINQIHLHVQITELSDEAAEKLIRNGISKLNTSKYEDITDAVNDFDGKISQRNVQKFKTIPLILMYLICLWHDGKPFGKSNCEVFSNIIGFLLCRADRRSIRTHDDERKCSPSKKRKYDMTETLVSSKYFVQYKTIIGKLCHLAFDTFFNLPKREHSTVFNVSLARDYMTNQELEFLKAAEILYQSTFEEETLIHMDQELKLSFAHITFAHFLAAYHFSALADTTQEMEIIGEVCNTVPDILSVAEFYICVCGLCPNKGKLMARLFSTVISNSDIIKGYREDMGSWNYFIGYNEKVKKLQTLQVDCIQECEENGKETFDIHMEDFIIDTDFKEEKYSTALMKLMATNRSRVKSLKVRDVTSKEKFHDIREMLETHSECHLTKFDVKCEFETNDLEYILTQSKKSLKCLIIKGGKREGNKWTNTNVILSNRSHQIIWSMKQLEELYLRNIDMEHGQLEQLVHSLSEKSNMKHIGLGFIKCKKHGETCKDLNLNLSKHKKLKMLELGDIPLSQVEINTSALEVCYVGNFCQTGILQSVLNSLRLAKKLHVFVCGFLKSSDDINNMLATIPRLGNLQHVWLLHCNLDNSAFKLCDLLKNVENVYLISVSLKGCMLNGLESLKIVRKILRVGFYDCKVQPQGEFDAFKSRIRDLRHFKVLQDESDEFSFRIFQNPIHS